MNRPELMKNLESSLFEVQSPSVLSVHARYALSQTLTGKANGLHAYSVVGSDGSQVTLFSSQELTKEPFVIMRTYKVNGGSARYEAITLSELMNLSDTLYGMAH